MLIDRYRIL